MRQELQPREGKRGKCKQGKEMLGNNYKYKM